MTYSKSSPWSSSSMTDPGSTIAVLMIQGTPRPMSTSKTFEPIALDMAMSPLPCFATITDERQSGTEVPGRKWTVSQSVSSPRY